MDKSRDKMVTLAREIFSRDLLWEAVAASLWKREQVAHSCPEGAVVLFEHDVTMYQALEHAADNPGQCDTNDHDALISVAVHFLRMDPVEALREGVRMPIWLARFAADVLEGKRKRPTKRGADKYANFERNYKLLLTAREVAATYGLPLYSNNEYSIKVTAAEIVAEAVGMNTGAVNKVLR